MKEATTPFGKCQIERVQNDIVNLIFEEMPDMSEEEIIEEITNYLNDGGKFEQIMSGLGDLIEPINIGEKPSFVLTSDDLEIGEIKVNNNNIPHLQIFGAKYGKNFIKGKEINEEQIRDYLNNINRYKQLQIVIEFFKEGKI